MRFKAKTSVLEDMAFVVAGHIEVAVRKLKAAHVGMNSGNAVARLSTIRRRALKVLAVVEEAALRVISAKNIWRRS
jgi:hypothetical protein